MLKTTLTGIALLVAAGATARATDYFTAPGGDDRHSGRGPDRTRALRTIQAGVDRLRPGDRLLIRGGIYRETIVFPRSGAPGRPLTLAPYHGESVVVSGADPLSGWTLHDASRHIWKAAMPWTLGTGRNQLFAGERVLLEAREPNAPEPGLEMPVTGLSALWPTFAHFSIPRETAAAQPGRIVSHRLDGQPDDWWRGALYYGLHYEGWCGQTGIVEHSRSGEITVGDRTDTWWFPSAYGVGSIEEGRGMLVGHMHALDRPGEWVWQDNTVYLIPFGSGRPQGVEAKHRQLAFDLSGREHIVVRGLQIRAASVRMEDSARCTFERCSLRYISHFLRQYSIGQVERGRDTIRSGETGIFVGGHDNAFLSCTVRYSAGAGFHLRGYHHTIHNCRIDEVSYTAHYLNAITDAVSDFGDYENFLVGGHVITYNTLCNAGRHFFNLYGNGTSTASRTRSGMDYMATLFAHNHLYNGMLQTRDAGFVTGYYCSAGTLNGLNSRIAFNVLHDCYDLSAMRWNILGPIYLDAGTCNVDVYNNLLWAAPGALQQGIWFNTCCADCSDHDNVLHRYFRRTSAELAPADFPRKRLFRFGCDLRTPPPLPRWPPVEARPLSWNDCQLTAPRLRVTAAGIADLRDGDWFRFDVPLPRRAARTAVLRFASPVKALNTDRSGRAAPRHRNATDPLVLEATVRDGASPGIGERWTFIDHVADGAWIRFDRVPLGEGYRRFRAVYGKVTDRPARIEVHLDAPDGPVVSTASLRQTDRPRNGNIQIYRQAVADLAIEASGVRDVYLVFRSDDPKASVGEFEYFRFEQYRGEIGLAPDEAKIEVRSGGPQGPILGRFYPRFTGGSDRFRDMVAPLDAPAGVRQLCFVVRSAARESIGRIAAVRLLETVADGRVVGLGAAPLLDRRGRPVLPEPTNLPRALSEPGLRSGTLPTKGLALWLDASDPATVGRDAQGHVSVWRDRSGHRRDAVQSDPARGPVFELRGMNGRPALAFSEAARTRLDVPDLATGRLSGMVFAVVRNPVPASERNHDARVFTTSDGTGYDYQVGIALTVPGLQTGGPRMLTATFDGVSARCVRIGCFSPLDQTFFTGAISEILVFDRILSPIDVERVRSYLVTKWRLEQAGAG